jgi:hypothetical protein
MAFNVKFKVHNDGYVSVYLENKRVGRIVRVAGGFQYRQQGKKNPSSYGDVFPTISDCKQSLI